MNILVNALSARSLSGRHVLFGHVRQLARWTESDHIFTILSEQGESIKNERFPLNVRCIQAPAFGRNWLARTVWERVKLPALLKKQHADFLFTPTGTIQSGCPVPQISLAQNPWCMMPGMQSKVREKAKAVVQRAAYRKAFQFADRMIYNSCHMRDLYQKNAGQKKEAPYSIVYQGIEDETHVIASQLRNQTERIPLSILSVSVMAPWKNIETTVTALKLLHERGIKATLRLVGPWADSGYRLKIESQIESLGLREAVIITGKVSREDLHKYYATSKVFCLMSRCESFGIPAVEAQAFGTPVVGSNVCAMPEIGGKGGIFLSPDDLGSITEALGNLLTDAQRWQSYSQAAIDNSQRYQWEECSKPLLKAFSEIGLSTREDQQSRETSVNQKQNLTSPVVES